MKPNPILFTPLLVYLYSFYYSLVFFLSITQQPFSSFNELEANSVNSELVSYNRMSHYYSLIYNNLNK